LYGDIIVVSLFYLYMDMGLFVNNVRKLVMCASNSSAAAAGYRGCWHALVALSDVAVWQFYISECCLVNWAFKPELRHGVSSAKRSIREVIRAERQN